MRYIESLSIRQKLTAILIIWVAIFVGFGIFAIVEMYNLGNVTKSVYEHPLQVTSAAKEARLGIVTIRTNFKDIESSADEREIRNLVEENKLIEQRVLDSFEIIRNDTTIEESRELEKQTREMFIKWYEDKQYAADYILKGGIQQAADLSRQTDASFIDRMEEQLEKIVVNSQRNSNELIKKTEDIENAQRTFLTSVIILVSGLSFVLFILMISSILTPINALKTAMKAGMDTGNLLTVDITGKSEISEMAAFYNTLVNKLKDMFWIKDTKNNLSQELSACISIKELARKAIDVLAEVVNAGKGVLYICDKESGTLRLESLFAFTESDKLRGNLAVGEGIIGQVALQRKPILQKNIKKAESYISTGIIDEAPLNIYTFPLIYESELYGVAALSSFEEFDKTKLELLDESSNVIAANLYAAMQNEKISLLLRDSEEARNEARKSAEELEKAYASLQEKQESIQRQSEELQQTNRELEEQQQILQRQSEELQQTNIQFEKQQLQLEEQARILNMQNKQLEENSRELIKRSKELETMNSYKSEFLANVSHELRTPLNSIILLSRLLLDKAGSSLEESDREKIGIIHKSGQELLRLINDILDISKIEAGRMNIDIQDFNSGLIIQEMRQMFEGAAKEKKISLVMKDCVQTDLRGDMHKISQILRNFISNAIKFTEEGYIELKIMHDDADENGVVFVVKDTGIGISEEQLSVIFEEFRQGDGSISRKYGGTGLGLSISKKLSALIGGEIKVSSEIGAGSEFYLCVPNLIKLTDTEREQGKEPEKCADSSIVKNAGSAERLPDEVALFLHRVRKCQKGGYNQYEKSSEESAPALEGKTILIVDDDPRNLFVLASALEDCGADIIEAGGGKTAIQKLREKNADLILMDIMMPEMDGYQAIKAIRGIPELRHIPIIAVTAGALKEDMEKYIEAGADDYISKPVDYDILKRLAEVWIKKSFAGRA